MAKHASKTISKIVHNKEGKEVFFKVFHVFVEYEQHSVGMLLHAKLAQYLFQSTSGYVQSVILFLKRKN